ncbi:MAG TPA: TolC family protein [Planctomycetota bacterium]|jgi:outer membrane protein TolC|nr:TolC family protein [Planctomycetota bacterium]
MTLLLVPLLLFSGADSPAGPTPRRRLSLTLEESLARALRFEANLAAARHAAKAAEARIGESEGIFDPVSTSQVRWTDQVIPSEPTTFVGAAGQQIVQPDRTETNFFFNTGVAQTLATGGTYNLLFQAERLRNQSTAFDPVSMQFVDTGFELGTSDLSLAITQPLLRGGWTAIAREPVRQAELARDLALADRAKVEQDLLFDVHVAFWNLVFTRDDREVKRFSLGLAERLLEINRRKVEVGASAPVEVYQAETEIALRRESLMTAENAILAAEDRLKALLYPFEERGSWDFEIVPATAPPTPSPGPFPSWEEVFEKGRAVRPDLERARAEVAKSELTLYAAENNKLPRLDLEGRIGTAGVDDRIHQTFDDTLGGDFPVHSVGVVLSFPFGNVTARAREAAAREDLAAARVRLRGLENAAAEEARGAVRDLRYLVEKREATRKSRDLAQRQLEAGEVKLEAGAATNFEVLQLQDELSKALTNERSAVLDHAKALAKLEKAQGTLRP